LSWAFTMDLHSTARKETLSLDRPFHGGTAWKLGDVEDFSSNLNPLGPPPGLDGMILSCLDQVDHYPDDGSTGFREALSDHYGLPMECLIAGAGSSELIRLFPEVFVSPGDVVLQPCPCFSEYGFGCNLMGASIEHFHLTPDNDFRVDFDLIHEKVNDGLKAIYLCNPNNPTGRIESRSRILELAEEMESRGSLLFLDECLLELVKGCENHSCASEVQSHPNIFIINSLTKSFGFPGIRIGYGIGSPEMIDIMEKARLSWNLGGIEQCIGTCCFRDQYDHVVRAREIIDSEKRRMVEELRSLGMDSIDPPDSFFFFTSLEDLDLNSSQFKDLMLAEGIMVRDCTSFGSGCECFTRFSVRTKEKNDLFISVLEHVLES